MPLETELINLLLLFFAHHWFSSNGSLQVVYPKKAKQDPLG